MATPLYLTTTASDLDTGTVVYNQASLTRVVSAGTGTTNTVAGPTSGVAATATAGGQLLAWFTQPLDPVTISGTITFNVGMSESNAQANTGAQVIVERCDGAGNVISTVVNSEKGVELTTSVA